MNVLFIIKSLASPGGGAERVLTSISSELAERGHGVKLLTLDDPASSDFYSVGPKVGRVRLGRSEAQPRLLAKATRAMQLRRAVINLEPDVAVAFMHSAFIPAALALVGTGVPLVGSERTSFDHYRTRPFERALLRATAPLLRNLTVNGEGIRRGFPRALAARMDVVPNPVAPASGMANAAGQGLKTLLSVGGLRPEKGHMTLISAFAALAANFPDWRLRVVGDGPLMSQLREQVRKTGLGDRIELTGATRSVEQEYRSAQLFVLPSIYEAFPNSLAEALAHGLPAIGYASCPGANELIIPGLNGELAAVGDRVDRLGACLARLMSTPALRVAMGNAAPASVADYRLANVASRWETLLQSATNGRRAQVLNETPLEH